jgi:hypothetical protein
VVLLEGGQAAPHELERVLHELVDLAVGQRAALGAAHHARDRLGPPQQALGGGRLDHRVLAVLNPREDDGDGVEAALGHGPCSRA